MHIIEIINYRVLIENKNIFSLKKLTSVKAKEDRKIVFAIVKLQNIIKKYYLKVKDDVLKLLTGWYV